MRVAVRDGSNCPPQPSAPGTWPGSLVVCSSPGEEKKSRDRLADHVGQGTEEARALDRLRELALLLGRHRGDAGGHDLAALGDVTLQQLHVLVVDLRRIGARERAGLAAAEEGAARAALCCECHWLRLRRGFSVVVAARAALATVAVAAIAAVATIAVAEAAAAVTALVAVAVRLAHHRRGAFLELFDADGEIAQHVLREALLALDLGQRSGRRLDVEQRDVRLAVLADAVGEGLQPPVLVLGDLAAEAADDVGELLGQVLDLLRAQVLARQIDVFVEGHEMPFLGLSPMSSTLAPSPSSPSGKARML